jgi:hypothetical protein
MLDFEWLSSGKRVPAVEASDMKRVWELTSEAARHKGATPGSVSVDIGLVVSQSSQGADPLAVFFRVVLLTPLLASGLLTTGATVTAPTISCSRRSRRSHFLTAFRISVPRSSHEH